MAIGKFQFYLLPVCSQSRVIKEGISHKTIHRLSLISHEAIREQKESLWTYFHKQLFRNLRKLMDKGRNANFPSWKKAYFKRW